jgi:anti-repressor protein
MNEMQIFNNPEFGDIRVIEINGEPWFVGKDIAVALGYSNTRDALEAHVDPEDKRVFQKSENATFEIPNRGLTLVNRSGVYALILSSKLPSAKKFKRWVTSEILPSVEKHGTYMTPKSDLSQKRQKTDVLRRQKPSAQVLWSSKRNCRP